MCVLYYNTKLWVLFNISSLTWEQGWFRSICASLQSDQTLLFSHTHQLHVVGYYNAEISLHKAIPESNIYITLGIKMLKSRCNNNNNKHIYIIYKKTLKKKMQLLGREPTSLVLIGHRRNHYATHTHANSQ